MKIGEVIEKDTSGRNRVFNQYDACLHCGKEYKKQKAHAEGAQQELYCSSVCYNEHNKKVKLNCSHCGIQFTRLKSQIKKRIKNNHINFCSRDCKDKAVHYMTDIRPAHYGTSEDYRIKAFRVLPNICNRCGFDNLLALEVHHVDTNRYNNDIDNLEILCANCHVIEHKINGY